MESHNSNNNNINNQSSVGDNGNDNNNSNNSTFAVTGITAWDLSPVNVTNIPIITDDDVEMEDVEEKSTTDTNNNSRKRRGASDMTETTKVAKKFSHNDEIVAVLEQRGSGKNENIVERAWYYMYMPDGTKTAIRLVPTTTTQELTRRLREAYGNMYCVAARLQGTTEVLRLDWSMNTLDMLGVYTVIVMA